MLQARNDRAGLLLGLAAMGSFTILFLVHGDFVLDDAFISFRFARNLALLGELTWNPGEAPVEGYTSFLWVLWNAAAIRLGFDPVAASKFLGWAASLGWIGFFVRRTAGWPLIWRAPVVAAIGMSAPIALLSTQGMETSLACLLVTLSAHYGAGAEEAGTRRRVAWLGFAFLAGLTRPDTVLFSLALAGVVVTHAVRADGWRALRPLAAVAAPFLALGGAYFAWRLQVFDAWLPNTFYVKVGTERGLFNYIGARYVVKFFLFIIAPYLIFAAWAMRSTRLSRRAGTLLIASATFLVYLTTILPVQGLFWRFAFPVFGPLLLVLVDLLDREHPPAAPTPMAVAAAIGLCLWPLAPLPRTLHTTEARPTHDRELVARALADLDGTFFLTESGAPAYYSGWRTADDIGLTSREIARNGLSVEFLESFEPDLVMVLARGAYDPRRRPVIDRYLRSGGFVALAAVRKFDRDAHIYFARRESPLFDELSRRLPAVQGVEHVRLESVLGPDSPTPY